MKIQPRQQLLEVWEAFARATRTDSGQTWRWGGRSGRNSISDAEQLLCLLTPATSISSLRLDVPDDTEHDVKRSLRALGDSVEIPKLLVKVSTEYLYAYRDSADRPIFSGGSYFSSSTNEQPTKDQLELDVVDSFAVSIRLSLAIIEFVRVYRSSIRRADLRQEVDELEQLASERLSAAMVGLLRSFAVSVFDPDSEAGVALMNMVTEGRRSKDSITGLQTALREVKVKLREITVGSGRTDEIANDNKLFECGWSWGVVMDAPEVYTGERVNQPTGTAEAAPYLYFTALALDCIRGLFSKRTRSLALLNDEQQRLSGVLRSRWDMVQLYWSQVARFGDRGKWPLQDIPWRTTDNIESDYLTLLVSSVMAQGLTDRLASENDIVLVSEVLRELAGRARITRRPSQDDPAISLHTPGYPVDLLGSETLGGPRLRWRLSDFSPQLLRQMIRLAGMVQDLKKRDEILGLVDTMWEDHIRKRQLQTGPSARLWDQTRSLYGGDDSVTGDPPSWYYTERVVGCLVEAAMLLSGQPLRSPDLLNYSMALLSEADHLFDQHLLSSYSNEGKSLEDKTRKLRSTLRRAREIAHKKPGTACALASYVLSELDQLAVSRRDAGAGV